MVGTGGDVLEDIKILVGLQEIDAEMFQLEKNRQRLPRLVALARETLDNVEAEMNAAKAALEAASAGKRGVESELQTEGVHLEKLKARSSEIKTNKEYFAHLKEIEDCQKKVAGLEDTSLQLMEKVEKAEAELAEKKRLFEEEEARFSESKVNIEKRFVDGDNRLAELKAKRAEIIPSITKEVFDYYELNRQRYPDSVVVEASNGLCTGCRLTLPPQIFNNVRKGEHIIKCNNCRRILFYKEKIG
jgi:hypothetical protein